MALDATVKGSSSNAYLTEVEATAYLTTERLYTTAWTSASVPTREIAIIWATFIIDSSYEFFGQKRTLTQSLRWPRMGAEDADGDMIGYDDIPSVLKKATATLALDLITSNRVAEPALLGLGIAEAKIGPLEVKLDNNDVKEIVSDEVRIMLAPLGYLKGGASESSGSIPLLRG